MFDPNAIAIVRQAASDAAWRKGSLRHLLHVDQQLVYDRIMASPSGRYVMEIARRWGKTHLLVVLAIEKCILNPKGRVVFGAPTLKHLQEFILPVFDRVLDSCPKGLRPEWIQSLGRYQFPNGAYVTLFGADDKRKADRGRGPDALLAIFDEAGFCPILSYVLTSVLRPQLLHSSGALLLGSTPAEQPDHDFTRIAEISEAAGQYSRRTIWDNPRLTRHQIEQFIADDARDNGVTPEQYQNSTTFRREYLAQRIVDEKLLVVPEAIDALDRCIVASPRPQFFDAFTVLDFGGNDPHAALFGYYDFARAKTVFVDELLLHNNETTLQLSDAIKAKERYLWGADLWIGTIRGARDPNYSQLVEAAPFWLQEAKNLEINDRAQPYVRWGDNDVQLLRDLHTLHGLSFCATAKHDKELQINNFRLELNKGALEINPTCVNLVRHIKTTSWASHKRNDYRRINGEHGDLLDCFVKGTMIKLASGDVPVEQVHAGDMAWTRDGLQRVLAAMPTKYAAPTYQVTLADGTTVVGTAEHPFWTQRGWVTLLSLTADDTVSVWTANPKSSCGTENGTGGASGQSTETTACTTCTLCGKRSPTCTGTSGQRPTGQSPGGTTSITATRIPSTTTSPISSASPDQTTRSCTGTTPNGSGPGGTSCMRKQQLLSGTEVPRDTSGTCTTPKSSPVSEKHTTACAGCAEEASAPRTVTPSCAAPSAEQRTDGTLESTTYRGFVPTVERRSRSTSTSGPSVVPVRVVSVTPTHRNETVFNLTVDGTPEYFANGILVHNCAVYGVRNLYRRNPVPANYGRDPTRLSVVQALKERERRDTMLGTDYFARKLAGANRR